MKKWGYTKVWMSGVFVTAVLLTTGISLSEGSVESEYCPIDYSSVNISNTTKL